MASASKTPNLNLPQWVQGDEIEREDFNAAFDAIDTTVASHLAENANKHIHSSGSNDDGSFIKYDDGTMITRKGHVSNIPGSGSGDITVQYPQVFIEKPITTLSVSAWNSVPFRVSIGIHNTYTNETQVRMSYTSVHGNAMDCVINIISIGRWK